MQIVGLVSYRHFHIKFQLSFIGSVEADGDYEEQDGEGDEDGKDEVLAKR